jgi:dTDP-6-deoxy-L-talose 4-dehydrogenase (NAD+)
MKRILVTGSTGFIGHHVVEALSKQGDLIACAVRNRTNLPFSADVDLIDFDLTHENAASIIVESYGIPNCLVHLAWGGLPNYKSLSHFEIEIPRHYSFLKAMVQAGTPQLVVAGTCLEYGLISGSISENCPANPITSYGLAKDHLRRALALLQKEKPFNLTWARLFYTFGPGQSQKSLLSLIDAAAQRGDKVFPMSGGEQLRDYLAVEAIADAIAKLVSKAGDPGCVNICSGAPISVRRLAERHIIERGYDIKLELGALPYNDYEPMAFWGDRSKLNLLLS